MKIIPHLLIILWIGLISTIYAFHIQSVNTQQYNSCILEEIINCQCGSRLVDDQGEEYYCRITYKGLVGNHTSKFII